MRDELRESLALLPRSSEPWIWVAKPSESRVKKFICGRSLPTAALSVEGPTKNKLGRTIMVSSHPSEPMVNESGLPDTGPCNDRNQLHPLAGIRPGQGNGKSASLRDVQPAVREHMAGTCKYWSAKPIFDSPVRL